MEVATEQRAREDNSLDLTVGELEVLHLALRLLQFTARHAFPNETVYNASQEVGQKIEKALDLVLDGKMCLVSRPDLDSQQYDTLEEAVTLYRLRLLEAKALMQAANGDGGRRKHLAHQQN